MKLESPAVPEILIYKVRPILQFSQKGARKVRNSAQQNVAD